MGGLCHGDQRSNSAWLECVLVKQPLDSALLECLLWSKTSDSACLECVLVKNVGLSTAGMCCGIADSTQTE
jgi:hypothetical protein